VIILPSAYCDLLFLSFLLILFCVISVLLLLLFSLGDDEKQLRQRNSQIKIVSILKTGLYFTIPVLERIADRYISIDKEYQEKQQQLIEKAIDTTLTYLPLIESIANLISEIDVLQGFATATSFSPSGYCRPVLYPRGSGILKLEVSSSLSFSFFLSPPLILLLFIS
jgi:hypothetical protein